MKIELDYIVPEPSRTAPNLIADLDVSANYIVDLYNQSNINRQYNDFLKGKSVVIVGPASYLEGRGLGEFFDSFDVVVRLNRSFHQDSSHIEYYVETLQFSFCSHLRLQNL